MADFCCKKGILLIRAARKIDFQDQAPAKQRFDFQKSIRPQFDCCVFFNLQLLRRVDF